jgi:hypothetical protein
MQRNRATAFESAAAQRQQQALCFARLGLPRNTRRGSSEWESDTLEQPGIGSYLVLSLLLDDPHSAVRLWTSGESSHGALPCPPPDAGLCLTYHANRIYSVAVEKLARAIWIGTNLANRPYASPPHTSPLNSGPQSGAVRGK